MSRKFSEKVKIIVSARQGTGEIPSDGDLHDALASADWTDDPGIGKAVLLPDGSELLNPVPHALPVGYVKEPSMMDIIDQRIRAHRALLEDAEVIDSKEELNDFDVGEEPDIFSLYEFEAMAMDAPGLDPAEAKPPPEIPEDKKEVIPNPPVIIADNVSEGADKKEGGA